MLVPPNVLYGPVRKLLYGTYGVFDRSGPYCYGPYMNEADVTALAGWETVDGPAERMVCDRLALLVESLLGEPRGATARLLREVGFDALAMYRQRVLERRPCDGR